MYTKNGIGQLNHSSTTSENEFEGLDDLIAAGTVSHDLFCSLAKSQVTRYELPSIAARLDAYYIPALPWRLFSTLVGLPGKALGLYLVLWRLSHIHKTASLHLTTVCLQGVGLSHDQKTRGLAALEAAGLVQVERVHGKNPRVTLCLEHMPWVK